MKSMLLSVALVFSVGCSSPATESGTQIPDASPDAPTQVTDAGAMADVSIDAPSLTDAGPPAPTSCPGYEGFTVNPGTCFRVSGGQAFHLPSAARLDCATPLETKSCFVVFEGTDVFVQMVTPRPSDLTAFGEVGEDGGCSSACP